MKGLDLGDIRLPIEAATETIAILAKRGAGKSYTAGVLVEEMLAARLQVVVLDPMGAWWGLRSSADGKSAGFPIAIIGGDHADVPLEASGGVVVADLLVDERLSAVVDVSLFSKNDRRRFVTDWLERLYHRNRDVMHVVIEEADLFAPQRSYPGDERMLGAMYDLVRRGRGRGLGSTLITQRSAALSKEVLEQAELLIALRTTGPRDRAAIDAWINVHGDDTARHEVMATLPSLPTGTAWVWWPVENILSKVAIRKKDTFDSSATPKPGEHRRAPKTVADVDLAALAARMAATIERAKAEDPRELRRQIAELKAELAKKPTSVPVEKIVERVVEKPVVTDEQLRKWGDIVVAAQQINELTGLIVAHMSQTLDALNAPVPQPPRPKIVSRFNDDVPLGRSEPSPQPPETFASTFRLSPDGNVHDALTYRLGAADRKFLAALAQFPGGMSKERLSLLSGYSARSGHFANVLGNLRKVGLIEPGMPLRITQAGIAAAGDYEPLPEPGAQLIDYWRGRIGKAHRAMLDVFVEHYPQTVAKEELAEKSGYSQTSGHFANVLGQLRTMGLVDGFRASQELMG